LDAGLALLALFVEFGYHLIAVNNPEGHLGYVLF
jgi:hypothetical protein